MMENQDPLGTQFFKFGDLTLVNFPAFFYSTHGKASSLAKHPQYGNTGCRVLSSGIQNSKYICLKIKFFKEFLEIFRNELMASLQNVGLFL